MAQETGILMLSSIMFVGSLFLWWLWPREPDNTARLPRNWATMADPDSPHVDLEAAWLSGAQTLYEHFQQALAQGELEHLELGGIPGAVLRMGVSVERLWDFAHLTNSTAKLTPAQATQELLDVQMHALVAYLVLQNAWPSKTPVERFGTMGLLRVTSQLMRQLDTDQLARLRKLANENTEEDLK